MEKPVIGFIPPIVGVENVFNTFRLGRKYATLKLGEEVFLMDEKRKVIFGAAEVLDVSTGPLSAMCAVYASENHTELHQQDGKHSERLYSTLEKIYGPHIVKPNKLTTVVTLRRKADEG